MCCQASSRHISNDPGSLCEMENKAQGDSNYGGDDYKGDSSQENSPTKQKFVREFIPPGQAYRETLAMDNCRPSENVSSISEPSQLARITQDGQRWISRFEDSEEMQSQKGLDSTCCDRNPFREDVTPASYETESNLKSENTHEKNENKGAPNQKPMRNCASGRLPADITQQDLKNTKSSAEQGSRINSKRSKPAGGNGAASQELSMSDRSESRPQLKDSGSSFTETSERETSEDSTLCARMKLEAYLHLKPRSSQKTVAEIIDVQQRLEREPINQTENRESFKKKPLFKNTFATSLKLPVSNPNWIVGLKEKLQERRKFENQKETKTQSKGTNKQQQVQERHLQNKPQYPKKLTKKQEKKQQMQQQQQKKQQEKQQKKIQKKNLEVVLPKKDKVFRPAKRPDIPNTPSSRRDIPASATESDKRESDSGAKGVLPEADEAQTQELGQAQEPEQIQKSGQTQELGQKHEPDKLQVPRQIQESGQTQALEQTQGPEQIQESGQTQALEQTQGPEQIQESGQTQALEQTQGPEQIQEPEQTQALEQTQEPEQIQEPGQTQGLEQIQKPGQTQALEQTKGPQQIQEPGQTQALEQTKGPEQIQEPEQTQALEQTKGPEQIQEPEQTQALEQTKGPEQIQEPGQTQALEQTKGPEQIQEPEQTQALEQTKGPEQIQEPEQTQALEQTKGPEQIQEPEQTQALEQTKGPEQIQEPGQTQESERIQERLLKKKIEEMQEQIHIEEQHHPNDWDLVVDEFIQALGPVETLYYLNAARMRFLEYLTSSLKTLYQRVAICEYIETDVIYQRTNAHGPQEMMALEELIEDKWIIAKHLEENLLQEQTSEDQSPEQRRREVETQLKNEKEIIARACWEMMNKLVQNQDSGPENGRASEQQDSGLEYAFAQSLWNMAHYDQGSRNILVIRSPGERYQVYRSLLQPSITEIDCVEQRLRDITEGIKVVMELLESNGSLEHFFSCEETSTTSDEENKDDDEESASNDSSRVATDGIGTRSLDKADDNCRTQNRDKMLGHKKIQNACESSAKKTELDKHLSLDTTMVSHEKGVKKWVQEGNSKMVEPSAKTEGIDDMDEDQKDIEYREKLRQSRSQKKKRKRRRKKALKDEERARALENEMKNDPPTTEEKTGENGSKPDMPSENLDEQETRRRFFEEEDRARNERQDQQNKRSLETLQQLKTILNEFISQPPQRPEEQVNIIEHFIHFALYLKEYNHNLDVEPRKIDAIWTFSQSLAENRSDINPRMMLSLLKCLGQSSEEQITHAPHQERPVTLQQTVRENHDVDSTSNSKGACKGGVASLVQDKTGITTQKDFTERKPYQSEENIKEENVAFNNRIENNLQGRGCNKGCKNSSDKRENAKPYQKDNEKINPCKDGRDDEQRDESEVHAGQTKPNRQSRRSVAERLRMQLAWRNQQENMARREARQAQGIHRSTKQPEIRPFEDRTKCYLNKASPKKPNLMAGESSKAKTSSESLENPVSGREKSVDRDAQGSSFGTESGASGQVAETSPLQTAGESDHHDQVLPLGGRHISGQENSSGDQHNAAISEHVLMDRNNSTCLESTNLNQQERQADNVEEIDDPPEIPRTHEEDSDNKSPFASSRGDLKISPEPHETLMVTSPRSDDSASGATGNRSPGMGAASRARNIQANSCSGASSNRARRSGLRFSSQQRPMGPFPRSYAAQVRPRFDTSVPPPPIPQNVVGGTRPGIPPRFSLNQLTSNSSLIAPAYPGLSSRINDTGIGSNHVEGINSQIIRGSYQQYINGSALNPVSKNPNPNSQVNSYSACLRLPVQIYPHVTETTAAQAGSIYQNNVREQAALTQPNPSQFHHVGHAPDIRVQQNLTHHDGPVTQPLCGYPDSQLMQRPAVPCPLPTFTSLRSQSDSSTSSPYFVDGDASAAAMAGYPGGQILHSTMQLQQVAGYNSSSVANRSVYSGPTAFAQSAELVLVHQSSALIEPCHVSSHPCSNSQQTGPNCRSAQQPQQVTASNDNSTANHRGYSGCTTIVQSSNYHHIQQSIASVESCPISSNALNSLQQSGHSSEPVNRSIREPQQSIPGNGTSSLNHTSHSAPAVFAPSIHYRQVHQSSESMASSSVRQPCGPSFNPNREPQQSTSGNGHSIANRSGHTTPVRFVRSTGSLRMLQLSSYIESCQISSQPPNNVQQETRPNSNIDVASSAHQSFELDGEGLQEQVIPEAVSAGISSGTEHVPSQISSETSAQATASQNLPSNNRPNLKPIESLMEQHDSDDRYTCYNRERILKTITSILQDDPPKPKLNIRQIQENARKILVISEQSAVSAMAPTLYMGSNPAAQGFSSNQAVLAQTYTPQAIQDGPSRDFGQLFDAVSNVDDHAADGLSSSGADLAAAHSAAAQMMPADNDRHFRLTMEQNSPSCHQKTYSPGGYLISQSGAKNWPDSVENCSETNDAHQSGAHFNRWSETGQDTHTGSTEAASAVSANSPPTEAWSLNEDEFPPLTSTRTRGFHWLPNAEKTSSNGQTEVVNEDNARILSRRQDKSEDASSINEAYSENGSNDHGRKTRRDGDSEGCEGC